MASTTTTTATLAACPACSGDITARLTLDLTIGRLATDDGVIPVTAKVVGAHVTHDCTPKATREASRVG